jgi:hypothetical protein
MVIEAPLSKYKKQTLLIMAVVALGFGLYCIYDGYYNEKFIEKHTKVTESGQEKPDSTLAFNMTAPYVLLPVSVGLIGYFFVIRNKKVVADDTGITARGKRIEYEQIEAIDKTHFDKKGYFIIQYQKDGGKQKVKLSDRNWDNLGAVLEELIRRIS